MTSISKPIVELIFTSNNWNCPCCGLVNDQDAKVIINDIDFNFFHDGHFGYGNWSGETYNIYLNLLDILGFSVIGSGRINNINSVLESECEQLEINHFMKPEDSKYDDYDYYEKFTKIKNIVQAYPEGDNNILIDVVYDKSYINNVITYHANKATISFPDKHIISLECDKDWNGNHDILFQLALQHVSILIETHSNESKNLDS